MICAVADVDDPLSVWRDVGLVGDEDDRDPLVDVQRLEERHDLLARVRVEVASRLVGEDEGGVHHQRSRDRDPLLLPSR